MIFTFLNRYKVLVVSLASVSLFATTVFAVSGGPFTPHETLDPDCAYNDVSGTCYVNPPTGSGGVVIGDPVSGGTANQVLYTDASGNVGSDANFTRTASAYNISASPATGQSGMFGITDDAFGLGIPATLMGYTTADGFSGVLVGDLSNAGAGANTTLVGFINPGGNSSAQTNYTYDGGSDEASVSTQIDDVYGSISYSFNTQGGFQIEGVDDSNSSNGFKVKSNSGSSIFSISNDGNLALKNHSGTGLFSVSNSGTVRISDAYNLPTADGTNGQVLTTNGSGIATWSTVGGGGGSSLIGCTATISPSGNTALGDNALGGQCPGVEYANTAIGANSLGALISNNMGSDSSRNTAVGTSALAAMQIGTGNVSVGYQSGYGFGSSNAVNNNVFVGSDLSYSSTSINVENNIAIGQGVSVSGNHNIVIGTGSSAAVDTVNSIIIGQALTAVPSNKIIIGTLFAGDQSNGSVRMGNDSVSTVSADNTGVTIATGGGNVLSRFYGNGSIALAGGSTPAVSMLTFGTNAGLGATSADNAIFLGVNAGNGATLATNSIMLGRNAGNAATNVDYVNFIGDHAGAGADHANNSIFIGTTTGENASNALNSTFIGQNTGNAAAKAKNSIFFGYFAGANDTVDNTSGGSSILIGSNTNTGGYSNSIAIGASATNTATNQFMIGSSTSPINEIKVVQSGGTSCIIDASGLGCSSDIRLKTNINDLPSNTLDSLLKLKTVTFNWNSNPTDNQQIGFIA